MSPPPTPQASSPASVVTLTWFEKLSGGSSKLGPSSGPTTPTPAASSAASLNEDGLVHRTALLRHVSELVTVAALNLFWVRTVFGIVAFLTAIVACAATIISPLRAVLGEVASLGIQLAALVTHYRKTRRLTFAALTALHVIARTTGLGAYETISKKFGVNESSYLQSAALWPPWL
ncbi:hypothetical protein F5Y04DRAFT_66312 [Hypomontagnella monticulosa]|nr:hypothetical protein F5Y04DRAFT_66312 [Hypomontagnella monticulosa]